MNVYAVMLFLKNVFIEGDNIIEIENLEALYKNDKAEIEVE